MAGHEALVPRNPVEIAEPFAPEIYFSDKFLELHGMDMRTEFALGVMNSAADDLHMLGSRFYAKCGLAFKFSREKSDADHDYIEYNEQMDLAGSFCTYSLFKAGKIIRGNENDYIRALCITFDDAFIMQYGHVLDADELLAVPILAIDKIERTN